MIVLETERLTLRHASRDDAEFMLRLLNEPSFLRFIGDRGVRTLDDAQRYITERLIDVYARHGFGLWVVERTDAPMPMGICGLVKRDVLPSPDIGFAFLPEFWSNGYAVESAAGVKRFALETLGHAQLLAVANHDNASSIRILERLGLELVRPIRLTGEGAEVGLYALDAAAQRALEPAGAS